MPIASPSASQIRSRPVSELPTFCLGPVCPVVVCKASELGGGVPQNAGLTVLRCARLGCKAYSSGLLCGPNQVKPKAVRKQEVMRI